MVFITYFQLIIDPKHTINLFPFKIIDPKHTINLFPFNSFNNNRQDITTMKQCFIIF